MGGNPAPESPTPIDVRCSLTDRQRGPPKKEERGKKYRGMSGIDWQAEKAKADDDSLDPARFHKSKKNEKNNSVSKQDVHFTATEGLH